MDYGTAARRDGLLPSPQQAAGLAVSQPTPATADGTGILIRPAPVPETERVTLQPLPATAADGQEQLHRFARLPVLSLIVIILTVQAALSATFLGADTASDYEALYLRAGHLEWAHWLHGVPIPAFATRFSGSPVIYPPLGALADSLGGVAGARILSLCFMVTATCLLWGTTARLFGRPAAFFAAAMFAVIGPTQHLGALATIDSLALLLVATAAWCACAARTREDATGWVLASAAALALANATMYSSVIFDPIVVIIAVLSACPNPGGKVAMRRGALLVTCLAGTLAALVRLGGPWYVAAISQTMTPRPIANVPVVTVLTESWTWIAVVLVAALAGLALSVITKQGRAGSWLIAALAAAALFVPLEQVRLQTTTALAEHLDFGAWFACIAGGYAVSTLACLPRPRIMRAAAAVCLGVALVPVAATGISQAKAMINWPSSTALIAALKPLVRHGGRFLADTDSVAEYYLPGTSWQQWSDTTSITRRDGSVRYAAGKAAPYVHAIRRHLFAVVILNFAEPALDRVIATAIRNAHSYELITQVPYGGATPGTYVIWAYQPAQAPRASHIPSAGPAMRPGHVIAPGRQGGS